MGLTNQLVIFGARSNPKSDNSVHCLYSHRPVTEIHTSGPVATQLLEKQGRMLRVAFRSAKALPACSRIGAERTL